VTFIQFKICCCVQNLFKIGWFLTGLWRYIDFQNGGCPPSWNCFTTIRDHPRSLCCWPQLPVKFHVNLIHRSEDVLVTFEFFAYLAWNAYSGSQNGTSLRKYASFKVSAVKIRWGVWPVGELTEKCDVDKHTDSKIYILSMHSIVHWTDKNI